MSSKQPKNINTTIVEDFSNRYNREFDFYNATSLLAAQLIETQLSSSGIRAIVTSRAKNPSRLHDKIKKRIIEEDKNYTNFEDIYEDIVDLSGVRIALYFNSESEEIEQIIRDIFDVHMKKDFPTNGKSQGYKATHYRGNIKESILSEQQKRYSKAKVEIQVASLLMHSWSEVEHDIIYKPLQGKVSTAEKKALDDLNILVLQGEEILKELQQATYKRNQLYNQYDLYIFLTKFFLEKDNNKEEQPLIGDIDKLYIYLLENKIDTQTKLKNRVKDLKIFTNENWTLSDQIMDFIEGNRKTKKRSYLDSATNSSKNSITTENAVGTFLVAWIELEKILKNYVKGNSNKATYIRLESLLDDGILLKDEYNKIHKIRGIRNNLVHGIEIPERDYLDWSINEIKQLTQNLKYKNQENNQI